MDNQKEFIKGLLADSSIKDLKDIKDKNGNIIKREGFMFFSNDEYNSENIGNFSRIAQKHFKDYPQQHRFYIYFELNKEQKDNIIFILYNPSYATPETNDPTINNCLQLAESSERFSSVEILNLYSERNPNIEKLESADNSANIKFITELLNNRKDSVIVLAWGNKKIPQEWNDIIKKLDKTKLEIITCKNKKWNVKNQIRHPGNQGWSRLGGVVNAELTKLTALNLKIDKLIKIDKHCG